MPACVNAVITAVMLAGMASVTMMCELPCSSLMFILGTPGLQVYVVPVQEELHTTPMLPCKQQLRLGGAAAQVAEEAWYAATSCTSSFLRPLFCGQYHMKDISLQLAKAFERWHAHWRQLWYWPQNNGLRKLLMRLVAACHASSATWAAAPPPA